MKASAIIILTLSLHVAAAYHLPTRLSTHKLGIQGQSGVRRISNRNTLVALDMRPAAMNGLKVLTSSVLAAALTFGPLSFPEASVAAPSGGGRQNAATASGSKVNKDAESLLRYGLPINNPEVRKLQAQLELAKTDLKVKRIGSTIGEMKESKKIIGNKGSAILKSVRAGDMETGTKLLAEIDDDCSKALTALEGLGPAGSVQERAALDLATKSENAATTKISRLEELMVPTDYKVPIPDEYKNLPVLQGRATVKFTVDKAEKGEQFNINGDLYDRAELVMVIDGYTAPITGGNLVDLISKKFYNGMTIQRSDGFVVQTGDPEGPADGYVPPGEKAVRTIPLEISVLNDKVPMWGSTTEEDLRGSAGTKLPFQSYGALGFARTEMEDDSGSSQFFWLLFDSDLTPAGKNLLDGSYACFGYTTEGEFFLQDMREGDVITKAEILDGEQFLVRP